jgi:hypothetical protein
MSSSQGNGQTEVKPSDLSVDEKLNVLIEGLAELSSLFEEFKEEVYEKLGNLTLDQDGFSVYDES